MKFLPLCALLSLALAPSPALAAPAAPEMELHIEVRGSVSADYAIMKRKLAVVKRGRPAAEAALTAQIAEKKAQLLKLGIPAAAVAVAEPNFQEGIEQGEFPGAMYAAVALEKPVGVADPDEQDEPVIEPADGVEAAIQAAKDAGAAARIEARKVVKKSKLPYWSGSAEYTVRLDDIRLYPAVVEVVGGGFRPTDDGTDFRFNVPDTVHARALAEALTNSRAEADLHAKALGAHVARIARVSNRETPITMPEVAAFIVQMDQRKNAWRLVATHSVSVAVDYVIVPN